MIVRPLPPVNQVPKGKPWNDHAEKDGFSLLELERLLHDCENQPEWRQIADLCCAYYDGKQLSNEQIYLARKNNLEPRSINLIARVINGVLGQEAKSRRDPRFESDDDEFADVADLLSQRMKEAQRESMADMAISNGYGSQVKAGIGWVEVSRSLDPLVYPYTVLDVHRNEMWWDWRAKRVDLEDARWMRRSQWKDLDEVIAAYPQHRDILERAEQGWAGFAFEDPSEEGAMTRLDSAYSAERRFGISRAAWLDGGRRRIRMHEVWYKVPAEVVVMRIGHRWVPIDTKNPLHMEAVSRGVGKMKRTITMQIRRAMYAGPHRLADIGTTRKRYPYTPFIAFRDDETSVPYGLISGMLAPQDEFNESRQRVQWIQKARRLLMDSDALDERFNNVADVADAVNRPDMVAILNPQRKNVQAIDYQTDHALAKELFQHQQDSKQLIQDIPGVYGPQLGNAPTGVTSGLAINSLVEQGIVAMGELNDNYGHARRLVFENLCDLIAEDHAEKDMQVAIGSGSTRRTIVLNTADPKTGTARNVVRDAPVKLGLSEVPASPAYQMQMSDMMGNMVRALAGTPHAGLLIPAWVENTSAFGPGRRELADDMRRMTGLPTTGDRQGAQEWQQQQQAAAAAKAELEQATEKAEIALKAANANQATARAELARAQAAQTLLQGDQIADEPDEEALIQAAIAQAMPRKAAEGTAQPVSA